MEKSKHQTKLPINCLIVIMENFKAKEQLRYQSASRVFYDNVIPMT